MYALHSAHTHAIFNAIHIHIRQIKTLSYCCYKRVTVLEPGKGRKCGKKYNNLATTTAAKEKLKAHLNQQQQVQPHADIIKAIVVQKPTNLVPATHTNCLKYILN